MPETKIKRPNKVYFHSRIWTDRTEWRWELKAGNGAPVGESVDSWRTKAAMLHNLAIVHGRELSAGDTVINGRQHNAWRWDLDAALVGIGLKPYAETYEVES